MHASFSISLLLCPCLQVKGKAVFVTGCDSGFGHALAKHLHELGFTVFAGCLLKVRIKYIEVKHKYHTHQDSILRHVIALFLTVTLSSFQDKGGDGAKELEDFNSDRMKVVQLDVCSEEQVNQAVEYIKDNLSDSERGK